MKTEITLSEQQVAILDWIKNSKGNAIIEAVAGSGKTFILVEGVKLMSGWVFLGAYNTKMGYELKEATKGMNKVKAGTFHSAGFGALRFRFKDITVEANKVRDIVNGMIDAGDEQLAPYGDFVIKLVGLAKDSGVGFFNKIEDVTPWRELVDKHDVADDLEGFLNVDDGIAYAQDVIKISNANVKVIDFSDMIYLVLMKNVRILQSDWVLIDEAQDTNPTRRALAKKMLKPGGRLIAVGDPRQAIFGFTGADADAMDLIREEFGTITLPLTNTFRCPKAVVRHANQWVDHIKAYDTNPEGEVISAKYEDVFGDKSEYKFSGDDAVICRLNAPNITLAFKLIRRGIPCRIEGRDIGVQLINLAGKWKIKSLDVLRDRLDKYKAREVQKAMAQGKEQKAESIGDRVDCLMVLIERGEELRLNVDGLCDMIRDMFSDSQNKNTPKDILVLSSVHKAKGLEWKRVFLLGRQEHMPSSYARQDWQMVQEINLIYVAVTRAMETLIEVD